MNNKPNLILFKHAITWLEKYIEQAQFFLIENADCAEKLFAQLGICTSTFTFPPALAICVAAA